MASADILYRRLVQVLAWEPNTPRTKEGFRDAIVSHGIAGAMCSREPEHEGKCLSFQRYYEAVFGEKLETRKK